MKNYTEADAIRSLIYADLRAYKNDWLNEDEIFSVLEPLYRALHDRKSKTEEESDA